MVTAFLLSFAANAEEMNCFPEPSSSSRGTSPRLAEISVKIDRNSGTATGSWNGQTENSELDSEEDNLAEFSFDGGAEAGVWETEDSSAQGGKKWVGFIMPSEESGMYRLKCELKNSGRIRLATN